MVRSAGVEARTIRSVLSRVEGEVGEVGITRLSQQVVPLAWFGAPMVRWTKKLLAAILLVVGVVTIFVVASNTSVVIHSKPHVYGVDDVPEAPVAIVLGAGVWNGHPSDVLADRLQLALDLYEAGRVGHILVSGDNDGRGEDEVNPMRDWLVARGVPSSAIYMDHAGFRTLDTMRRARSVFGVSRAIVCTQAFHLDRAVYLARNSGIEATGVAAPPLRWTPTQSASLRELAARSWALVDVTLDRQPQYLGDAITIGKVAAARTHDRNTR